jgi:hypothetical protein
MKLEGVVLSVIGVSMSALPSVGTGLGCAGQPGAARFPANVRQTAIGVKFSAALSSFIYLPEILLFSPANSL